MLDSKLSLLNVFIGNALELRFAYALLVPRYTGIALDKWPILLAYCMIESMCSLCDLGN